MVRFFSVANWDEYQHYNDRAPPWIKFYSKTLDNYEIGCLQDASKAHLFQIWLLASRHKNRMPFDPEWIGRKINATTKVDLKALETLGLITVEQDASTPLAECSLETETETEVVCVAPQKKSRKPRRMKLGSDWWLSPQDSEYARKCGLTDVEAATLANEFRRYWIGPDAKGGGLKADWHGTWCNNVDRNVARIVANRARGARTSPDRPQPGSVFDVVARLKAAGEGPQEIRPVRDGIRDGGLRPAEHDVGAENAGAGGGELVIDAADAERMFGSAGSASLRDGEPHGAGGGHRGATDDLREDAGGLPGGRSAARSENAAENLEVVAGVGRISRAFGPAQQIPNDAEDDLAIPAFMKRTG